MAAARASLLALSIAAILAPRSAHASSVFRSFYELCAQSEDIVVARVESLEGEPGCFCQGAWLLVERSFEGRVRPGPLELPFLYKEPFVGTDDWVFDPDPILSFEVGKRYLLLLERTPPPSSRIPLNLFQPATEYWVVPYPRRAIVEIRGDDHPVLWDVQQLRALGHANDASAREAILTSMLAHTSPQVRMDAIEALTALDAESILDATERLLSALASDVSEHVRWRAAAGLRNKHGPDVAAALAEAIKNDPSDLVRDEALAALRTIGDD